MKYWYWLVLLGLSICVSGIVAFSTTTVTDSAGSVSSEAAENQRVSESEGDRLRHPPARQVFTHGSLQLIITAVDGWRSPRVIAQLYQGATLRWERPLPHEYGPRFVILGPQGQTLLLDEYINVAIARAITLLSPEGEPVAQYSFEDISQEVDVSAAQLTRQAISGWWISAVPDSRATTHQAFVKAGNSLLAIDLSTGELTHRDL